MNIDKAFEVLEKYPVYEVHKTEQGYECWIWPSDNEYVLAKGATPLEAIMKASYKAEKGAA